MTRLLLVTTVFAGLLLAGNVCASDEFSPVNRDDNKVTTPTIDEAFIFQPAGPGLGEWEPAGLDYQNVSIDSTDGVTLHGWYCPVKNPLAVVLYLHGNAGNITHRAATLRYLQNRVNVSVLIFDYRGYGKSTGIPDAYPTVAGVVQDARAARTALSQRAGLPESNIVLLGRSLGGAIAIQLAAESPCRGLILESTFSSFKEIADYHAPQLAWMVPPEKLNSVVRITRYHGPVLMSHGDRDRVVPFRFGLALFEAANKPKQFFRVQGGGHNTRSPDRYFQVAKEFLRTLPGPAGSPK